MPTASAPRGAGSPRTPRMDSPGRVARAGASPARGQTGSPLKTTPGRFTGSPARLPSGLDHKTRDHKTPLTASQQDHVRRLMAENNALHRKMKASTILTDELHVRIAQLEEPDKGTVAAARAESAIKDMHRLLDESADPEEAQLWDERVGEFVQVLCSMEELEISNKELAKTVRNQEKRVLNTEDMEIDFSRQVRQMQDDLGILQTQCAKVKHAWEHADRNMKMQAIDIDKRKAAVERLQVKLYGRPIDEIRPLIKEIKELRVIVDEAEAQFAGISRENEILDKEYEVNTKMFNMKIEEAFTHLQSLAIGMEKLKGLLGKLDARMQIQLLTRTNANVTSILKTMELDDEDIADDAASKGLDETEIVSISAGRQIIAGKRPSMSLGGHEGTIRLKKPDGATPSEASRQTSPTRPKQRLGGAKWSKLRNFVKASAGFEEGAKKRRASYADYHEHKDQEEQLAEQFEYVQLAGGKTAKVSVASPNK